MSSTKATTTTASKREKAKTHQMDQNEPVPRVHVNVHDLAQVVLDILDHLCSADADVEHLVNETKPKLEAILRSFE